MSRDMGLLLVFLLANVAPAWNNKNTIALTAHI